MNQQTNTTQYTQSKLYHQQDIEAFAHDFGIHLDEMIDFSQNTWPYPLHNELQKLIEGENLSSNQHNKSLENESLKNESLESLIQNFLQCASAYYHLPLKSIVGLSGEYNIVNILISSSHVKRVLTVEPTTIEYQKTTEQAEKEWLWFPGLENLHYEIPLNNLINKIEPHDLILLQHPNSPTGCPLDEDHIQQVVEAATENSAWVLVDETFIELISTSSIAPWVLKYKNLLVRRSLSHFFGLHRFNITVLLAHPATKSSIQPVIPKNSMSPVALKAGAWALTYTNSFEHRRQDWLDETAEITDALKHIRHNRVYPTQTIFILFQMPNEEKAINLQHYLGKQGLFIPNCGNQTALDSTHFQICARDQASNLKLIEAIQDFATLKT